MIRHAAGLHRLWERTGKLVSLALEPEPCCHMETVDETVQFFEAQLFRAPAVTEFGRLAGLRRRRARGGPAAPPRASASTPATWRSSSRTRRRGSRALRGAGIRVGKVQISAGLRVALDPGNRALLDALRPFAEGVYLHQVVERRDGRLTRYLDLPEALEAAARDGGGPREWRIHFHVPLFREELGRFASTQDYLRGVLGLLRHEAHTPHLEVETYTWDVLPEEYRREDIASAVARELHWVLERARGQALTLTSDTSRRGARWRRPDCLEVKA